MTSHTWPLAWLALVAACAPARSPDVLHTAPPASTEAHVEESVLCDVSTDDMRDLMFAGCEQFVPKLEKAIAAACRHVVPALAAAAVGIGGKCYSPEPVTLAAGELREQARVSAALQLLPTFRKMWPDGIPCDDLGREIWEVDGAWRKSQPDAEIGAAYTTESGVDGRFRMARVTVGTHLFALALAPHLTPIGRQYLRKLVVCEMRTREDGAERREREEQRSKRECQ